MTGGFYYYSGRLHMGLPGSTLHLQLSLRSTSSFPRCLAHHTKGKGLLPLLLRLSFPDSPGPRVSGQELLAHTVQAMKPGQEFRPARPLRPSLWGLSLCFLEQANPHSLLAGGRG